MQHTNTRPKKIGYQKPFSFEGLYAEISEAWEQKAKQLQQRRWQKMKASSTRRHHDRVLSG